jgi:hypothetical protein
MDLWLLREIKAELKTFEKGRAHTETHTKTTTADAGPTIDG